MDYFKNSLIILSSEYSVPINWPLSSKLLNVEVDGACFWIALGEVRRGVLCGAPTPFSPTHIFAVLAGEGFRAGGYWVNPLPWPLSREQMGRACVFSLPPLPPGLLL